MKKALNLTGIAPNKCKTCRFAKDRFKESSYCTMYGIIVTYGKRECKGFKKMGIQENEQARGEWT